MKRALVVLALLGGAALSWRWYTRPLLRGVGPRLISNQTSQPLALYGSHFERGMRVRLGGNDDLDATVTDDSHAYVRVPAAKLTNPGTDATFTLTVGFAGGETAITVIDDQHFADPVALALSKTTAFAISTTTDTLFSVDLESHEVGTTPTCDGPRAVAVWQEQPVVACAYDGKLVVGREASSVIEAPLGAAALWIEGDTAYVAGHVADDVWAIDLLTKRVLWRASVAPNPSVITGDGSRVFVGSQQFGAVDVLARENGKHLARVAPDKHTHILSGRTEQYSAYVMGGKAVRGLVLAGDRLFVSSIGPNVGPNPSRLEITHDAGVSVVDDGLHVTRHVGLGAGVTEGLAADSKHVYAADIASGVVHVFDLKALSGNDTDARRALLSSIAIPTQGELTRSDLVAGPHRVGPEVHSGPRALAVAADGKLWVLNRFTGTLAVIDVANAKVLTQISLTPETTQTARRRGEVLYYGDFGRSGMTCDSCHPDGHVDGVFFEKTRPLRIYRATTVRGAVETPPYFIPTSTRSLLSTSDLVGNRNRLHRLPLSERELSDLTLYSATVPTLPNPHVGADGAPPASVTLPDGHQGQPARGAALFSGKAQCASCHPAPLFTLDQDDATRDQHFDVGTPHALPLRQHWQDAQLAEFPAPSLLGLWDEFPLLTSGAAGLGIDADEQLQIKAPFALRDALESYGVGKHGRYDTLSTAERDDLLAYLLCL